MTAAPARRPPTANLRPEKSPQSDLFNAGRFLAALSRDRQVANDARRADNDNAIPASGSGSEEPAFLELPTRSYARPRTPSEEEQWAAQQRGMAQTAQRFSYPEQQTQATPAAQPAAPVARSSPSSPNMEGEGATMDRQEPEGEEAGEAQRMAALDAQQNAQAKQEEEARRAEARTQAVSDRVAARARIKRLQNIWRATRAAELATSEAILPLIVLVLQMNLQLVNEYTFEIRAIPPLSRPEKVALGVVNGIVFTTLIMILALMALVVLAAWAASNPTDAIQMTAGA